MTLVRYKFLHSKSRKDKLKYAENTASMHTHGTRTPRAESPLSNQVTLAPKFRDDNRQPPLFCTPSPSLDHSVEWYRKTGTSALRSIWCATLHADSSVASVRIKWDRVAVARILLFVLKNRRSKIVCTLNEFIWSASVLASSSGKRLGFPCTFVMDL